MNQKFLCTSAIALGTVLAAPVSAAEWDVEWGGYIYSYMAFVDTSGAVAGGTDFDGLSQLSTGEIHFKPSITLDNGLTMGANIQLEAFNNVGGDANNIDESYVYLEGGWGRFIIGAKNSAGYLLTLGEEPERAGNLINSREITAFVPFGWGVPFDDLQAGISSKTEVAGNDDVNRLTYITPRFAGFQLGVSYARNDLGNADQGFGGPGGTASNDNNNARVKNIFDIGANYTRSFGDFDVAVSGRWGIGDAVTPGAPNPKTMGFGIDLGYGGVTIGGRYADNDNGNGYFGYDQYGWSAGIKYDGELPGSLRTPWAFKFETYMGSYDNAGGPGIDQNYKAYRIGASRQIGPGVDLDLYAIRAKVDTDGTNAGNVNGYIIGTGIKLSF